MHKTLNLYKVDGQYLTEPDGAYVMDPHPEILKGASDVMTFEGVLIPFNDGSMVNCIAVKRNRKIGLLFADGHYQSDYVYRSSGNLFRFDKIRIYANQNRADEIAYAIALENNCWRLLRIDVSKQHPEISLLQEIKESDGDSPESLIWSIPSSHLYGFGCSPFDYTPERIMSLKDNEIFVFGSNKEGRHGGGAARVAAERFGAQYGVGVGRTGQCYAIPTMDGSLDLIREYVEGFRCYAFCHPELTFYVTRIGCGIAGWKEEQITPLFDFGFTGTLVNVIRPEGWNNNHW